MIASRLEPDDCPSIKPKDIRDALGIGLSTALLLMTSGQIQSFRVGRFWRTTPRIFREYVESNRAKYPAPSPQ